MQLVETTLEPGVYILVKTTDEGGVILPAGLNCPQFVADGKRCKNRDYRPCYVAENGQPPLMVPDMGLKYKNEVKTTYKTQDGSCTWKINGKVVPPTSIDGPVMWFDTPVKWKKSYYSWPAWGDISKINGEVKALDRKLFTQNNNFTFNQDTHLFYPVEGNGFLPDKEDSVFVNDREYKVVKIIDVKYPDTISG